MLLHTKYGRTIGLASWSTLARRMPKCVLVGGTILVGLGVVSGCGAVPGEISTASSPPPAIPWIQVSGKVFISTPAARACGASDLRVKVRGNGVAEGQVTEDLTLVNSAPDACFFHGPPALRLISPGKSPITVRAGSFAAQRVNLEPNQQVEMILGCKQQTATMGTSLILSPAGGGSITVGIRLPACLSPSIVDFQEGPIPTPTGVGALSVQLNMPASVTRGQVVSYSVNLSNTTAAAVSLSPCPSYTEHMSQPQGLTVSKVQSTFLLNCQVASSVPADGSLTFQMEIRVPANWRVGPAKFLWNLEVDGLPAAGSVVQVN
jgi:hypothetical protein